MKVKALFVVSCVFMLGVSAMAPTAAAPGDQSISSSVIFFGSDGMRPDLMEQYADAGFMPNYQDLMKKGARGDNGLQPAFPPNTGVGWTSLATGAYPSVHGSMNNTFHVNGDDFANRTSAGITQSLYRFPD